MDRMMIERATCTVVAAESRKIGREGFSHVCGAEQIGWLVTDSGADAETSAALKVRGVQIKTAE